MSRRRRAKKRIVSPDPTYQSSLIHMLVNRVMKDGKKALAYKIVYDGGIFRCKLQPARSVILLIRFYRNMPIQRPSISRQIAHWLCSTFFHFGYHFACGHGSKVSAFTGPVLYSLPCGNCSTMRH